MNNLKCDATKCVYNKKCECYAGKICVDGSQAVTTSDTYCATFRENENNCYTSDAGCCCHEDHAVGTSEIKCEAVHCVYNDSKVCSAPSVQINDIDASCNTFKAR